MKVTFGRRAIDAMPVTTRRALTSTVFNYAVPLQAYEATSNSEDVFSDVVMYVAPSTARYSPEGLHPITDCDQMFKCHVISNRPKYQTKEDMCAVRGPSEPKVTAELVDGNTVSGSTVLSAYTINPFIPAQVQAGIRQAILAVTIDTITNPDQ